jgi:hypothetical protein
MSKVKAMGASPLTNKIYYGTLNTATSTWVGNKTDVTFMAKRAVAEHLIQLDAKKYAFGMGDKFVVVSAEIVDQLPPEFGEGEEG